MDNLKKLILFLAVTCIMQTSILSAFAEAYGLQDLKALLSSKDYTEFFLHAKDIPPEKRNEDWQKLIVSAITGIAETKIGQGEARFFWEDLMGYEKTFPFLADNSQFRAIVKKTGLSYMSTNGNLISYTTDEIVNRLIAEEPSLIIKFVTEDHYGTAGAKLTRFISESNSNYANNQALSEYLLKQNPFPGEESSYARALEKMNLKSKYVAEKTARFEKIMTEVSANDKTHDDEISGLRLALEFTSSFTDQLKLIYTVNMYLFYGQSSGVFIGTTNYESELLNGLKPGRIPDRLRQKLVTQAPPPERKNDRDTLIKLTNPKSALIISSPPVAQPKAKFPTLIMKYAADWISAITPAGRFECFDGNETGHKQKLYLNGELMSSHSTELEIKDEYFLTEGIYTFDGCFKVVANHSGYLLISRNMANPKWNDIGYALIDFNARPIKIYELARSGDNVKNTWTDKELKLAYVESTLDEKTKKPEVEHVTVNFDFKTKKVK